VCNLHLYIYAILKGVKQSGGCMKYVIDLGLGGYD
jgi:hypothetical protein